MRYLLFLSLFVLAACGDSEKDSADHDEVKTQVVAEEESDVDDSAPQKVEHYHRLPSPLQIANLFQDNGLQFRPGLVLPDQRPEDYSSSVQKMLIMGACSSDLAYSALNDQEQTSMEKLDEMVAFATDLGFASGFTTESNVRRFQDNIHDLDSVMFLIAGMERDLELYIKENQEEERATLMFCGAWLEMLELGRKVLADEMDMDMVFQLLDQQHICSTLLDNLHKMESYGDDAFFQDVLAEMVTLNARFSQFDLSSEDEIEIDRDRYDLLVEQIASTHEKLLQD